MRYRAFHKSAPRKPRPTSGRGEPTLVYAPKPRRTKSKLVPLSELENRIKEMLDRLADRRYRAP